MSRPQPVGSARCVLETGEEVVVPVFVGILKHPAESELPRLLSRPAVLRKYTYEALRVATWRILLQFPRAWLEACLPEAGVRPGRLKALEFMLLGRR